MIQYCITYFILPSISSHKKFVNAKYLLVPLIYYLQAIFKIFQIWTKLVWLETMYPYNSVMVSCYIRFLSLYTLCNWLNVKELVARNERDIWRSSDWNRIWTYNHLVRKRTFNYLSKPTKLLSVSLRTKWLRVGIPLNLLYTSTF